MSLTFLSLDSVAVVHRYQIDTFGGIPGVRDEGLLQSAVSMPASTFGGQKLHKDVFEMAGAYLFHIVRNHPFLDGNKRTGAACAAIFLELNGFQLSAHPDEFTELTMSVARGEAGKFEAAEFFRAHTRSL